MATKEEVLAYIADFKGLSVGQLTEDVSLALNSLTAQRFRTALQRKYGIAVNERDMKTVTVKDILSQLEEKNTDLQHVPVTQGHTLIPQRDPASHDGIGIDIENVQEFRTSVDPQSDPFFVSIFTPAEFGYCLLQGDPAQHFAARFCAKEALRKCGSNYADLAFNQIQIINRDDGAPYYHIPHLSVEVNNVSLSLSHTHDIAIAVAARRVMSELRSVGEPLPLMQDSTKTENSNAPAMSELIPVNIAGKLARVKAFVWILLCLFVGESIIAIHQLLS